MNNFGSISETATAFPGQTGVCPNSVAPLEEMLRLNGYSTAAAIRPPRTLPPSPVSPPTRSPSLG